MSVEEEMCTTAGTAEDKPVVHDGMLRPAVDAKSREASRQLARLMERQCNYAPGRIDPNTLRLFIEAHWYHITRLANTIHENRESP